MFRQNLYRQGPRIADKYLRKLIETQIIHLRKKRKGNNMVMQEKLIAEIEKRKAKDDLYRDISELEDAEKAELLTIMESVALKFIEDNFNLIAEYSLMTWSNEIDEEILADDVE